MDRLNQTEFSQPPQLPAATPESWGEPVVIGSEDATDDTGGEFVDDRFASTELGVEPAPDATDEPPITADGPADVPPPPEDPGSAEAADSDGPERGAALYRVVDYAVSTTDREEQAPTDPDLDMMQYDDDLRAVGLDMTATEDSYGTLISLHVADPETFADALVNMPIPEDPEYSTTIADRLAGTPIDTALLATRTSLTQRDQPGVAAALGGSLEGSVDAYYDIIEAPEVSEAGQAFATAVCANADKIAAGLERLGLPERQTEPLRLLGIAQTEGLTTEWAVGYGLDIIGQSSSEIGIHTLETPQAWEPVYRFCEHLAETAPEAAFTHALRDRIVNDITEALAPPDKFLNLRGEDGELPRFVVNTLFTQTARNLETPGFLEAARDRILQILPRA
jgi:hypothetical protein